MHTPFNFEGQIRALLVFRAVALEQILRRPAADRVGDVANEQDQRDSACDKRRPGRPIRRRYGRTGSNAKGIAGILSDWIRNLPVCISCPCTASRSSASSRHDYFFFPTERKSGRSDAI